MSLFTAMPRGVIKRRWQPAPTGSGVTNDWAPLNIPHPDYFQIDQPIPDLTISGDMVQDITLRCSCALRAGSWVAVIR